MRRDLRVLLVGGALALAPSSSAFAQKPDGTLRIPHFDSPASMSLLEESTVAVNPADDERFQQSRHVRSARAAEQPEMWERESNWSGRSSGS